MKVNGKLADKDKMMFEKIEKIRKIRSSEESLYQFLKENVEKVTKREIMRNSRALDKGLAVITDRSNVKGFYVDINVIKFLPPEVQAFFFNFLDALECKYIISKK